MPIVSLTGMCRISCLATCPSLSVTRVIGWPPCPPRSNRPWGSFARQIQEPLVLASARRTSSTLKSGSVCSTAAGSAAASCGAGFEPSAGPYTALVTTSFWPAGAAISSRPPSLTSRLSSSLPMRYSTCSFLGTPGAVSPKVSLLALRASLLSLTAPATTAVTLVASSARAGPAARMRASAIRAPAVREARQLFRGSFTVACISMGGGLGVVAAGGNATPALRAACQAGTHNYHNLARRPFVALVPLGADRRGRPALSRSPETRARNRGRSVGSGKVFARQRNLSALPDGRGQRQLTSRAPAGDNGLAGDICHSDRAMANQPRQGSHLAGRRHAAAADLLALKGRGSPAQGWSAADALGTANNRLAQVRPVRAAEPAAPIGSAATTLPWQRARSFAPSGRTRSHNPACRPRARCAGAGLGSGSPLGFDCRIARGESHSAAMSRPP